MTAWAFADDAIQAALTGKDVVVLSTLMRGGAPLAMPMWFVHDASELVMVSAPGLAKVRNMARDPRVCVVVEGGDRSGAFGVTLTGSVEFFDDERRALWGARFCAKYSPEIERIWGGDQIPANRVVFGLAPRVATAYGI